MMTTETTTMMTAAMMTMMMTAAMTAMTGTTTVTMIIITMIDGKDDCGFYAQLRQQDTMKVIEVKAA